MSDIVRKTPPLGLPYIEIVKGECGLFHIVWKAANHEILMASETFDSESNAHRAALGRVGGVRLYYKRPTQPKSRGQVLVAGG